MWFDGQAEQFDDWAGLDPATSRAVAEAILEQSGATADDLILDVGAGTGAVGVHFATLSNRYVGLDYSPRMLQVFQQKLKPPASRLFLLQADVACPWPIRDGGAAVVFASRVAHHLPARHFLDEVFRVCRSGGCLFLGRVTRDADSLPSRLQRHKRALLSEQGLRLRGGGQAIRQLVDECVNRGATVLGPIAAAQWTRTATARRFLSAWEGKPRLDSGAAGEELDVEARAAVMNNLAEWAASEFGDLDRPQEFVEEYTLLGVRLP